MFTAFTSLAQGGNVSVMSFVNIPVSIMFGIIIGIIIGKALAVVWKKLHIRDTVKAAIFLSVALLLVDIEASLNTPITFASLISVMFIGIALKKDRPEVAFRLSQKYNKMWVWAEVMLFVLVGATVDIGYVAYAGVSSIVIIIGALIFRMAGGALCMAGTKLKLKERVFCMLAYTPKATVQAAIGGVPLSMGLACGNTVLTVAVLAIIITAPLGAFAIDMTYRKLLKKS